MDTSHRNNVPLCEDDDDLWYWGYSIFVPHIPNTRAYLNICVVIDHVFYRMQDSVALVVLAHFQQAAAFTVHKDRTHIVYNVFFVDTEYPWRNDWAALGLQLRAVVVEYSSDSGDGITVFFRYLGERVPKRISLYQLKKPVCHLPVFKDAFRYICKCLFARIAEVSFYL